MKVGIVDSRIDFGQKFRIEYEGTVEIKGEEVVFRGFEVVGRGDADQVVSQLIRWLRKKLERLE